MFTLRANRRVLGMAAISFLVKYIMVGLSTGKYLWRFGPTLLCLIFIKLMLRIAGVVETRSFSKLRSLQ